MKVCVKEHISSYRTLRDLKPGMIIDVPSEWADQLVRSRLAEKVWTDEPKLEEFEVPKPSKLKAGGEGAETKEEGLGEIRHPLPAGEIPKTIAYDKLVGLTGYHLAEIYGVRGTGKSRLVHSIAVEAQEAGKRVLFIDTEGGLDEKHIKQLDNYEYIGDELDDLREAVDRAKRNRGKYELLVVDSVGHPVYVNYVTMGGMDQKLKSYQELAALFRDMVRFSRGEKGMDLGRRFGLSIAVDHTVSEFSRIAKELPAEEPLDPFGGQIHRVPKLVLRSEPLEYASDRSIFGLLTWKARDLPKNFTVAQFSIEKEGIKISWKI